MTIRHFTPSRLIRCAAITVASVVGASARAQSTPTPGFVDGIVTNADLLPLPNATVSILGSTVHVTTGENGRFRMSTVPTGRYIFVIHRVGYIALSTTVEVVGPDTVRPSFSLEPITTSLDTVVVKARASVQRMTEFENRRHAGQGTFLTADDIDRRHARAIGELLRTALPVQVVDRGGQYAYTWSGCPYGIFLDGVRMGGMVNLNSLPDPSEVAGIEIYASSSTVPIQYNGNIGQTCGAIMLWTKGG